MHHYWARGDEANMKKHKALEGRADHVSGWMQIRDEWLKRTGSRFDGGYVFVDSFSQVVKIKMWKWFFTIHDAIRYPLRILDEVTEGGGFDVERSWFEHSLGHNKKAQTLTWTACLVEKGHPTIQIELSRHNQAWCNVIVVAVKE